MPEIGEPLPIGRGRILREGTHIAILSYGTRLTEALKAAKDLETRGLSTTVADARFAKPLDVDLILRLAREHEVLITIEEGAAGGFGSAVVQKLLMHGALDHGLRVRVLTLPDVFLDQDQPEKMYAKAGLDASGIIAAAFEALKKPAPALVAGRSGALNSAMHDRQRGPDSLDWADRDGASGGASSSLNSVALVTGASGFGFGDHGGAADERTMQGRRVRARLEPTDKPRPARRRRRGRPQRSRFARRRL